MTNKNPSKKQKIFIFPGMIAFSFIVLLLLIRTASCQATKTDVPNVKEMKTITIEDQNIQIAYPTGWFVGSTPQGNHGDKEVIAVIGISGKSFPNALIAQKKLSKDDINVVANWGEQRAKQRFEDYQSLSLINYQTASFDGKRREYTGKMETLIGVYSHKCVDWYVIQDQNGYCLSLCSDEKDWGTWQQTFYAMIEGFSSTNR